MDIPYAYGSHRNYDISCTFGLQDFQGAVDNAALLRTTADVLKKHDYGKPGYPYLGGQGRFPTVYVGSDLQYIICRERSSEAEFSYHNIDTAAHALACAEIVHEYLLLGGIKQPFVQKRGALYEFEMPQERHSDNARVLKTAGSTRIEQIITGTMKEYHLQPEFRDNALFLEGQKVMDIGPAFRCQTSSARIALASFATAAYIANLVTALDR